MLDVSSEGKLASLLVISSEGPAFLMALANTAEAQRRAWMSFMIDYGAAASRTVNALQ